MQSKHCIAVLAFLCAIPARAEDLGDWTVPPWKAQWGDWTASLGGLAGGAFFTAGGNGPVRQEGANLSALFYPRLETTLDEGWEIGIRGAILAYHDRLAGDIYGSRTFEKGYLFAQMPYGRFEVGQVDGAGYRLSITGPSVDEAVTLANPSTTFFRDPQTGRAFIDRFRLNTAELASSNDTKFTYLSPQWFGLQLAGSYTPYDAHGGLPFVSRGRGGNDRQSNIFEGAAAFAGYRGALSYGLYASFALAHDDRHTSAHASLRDWSVGAEADYPLDDAKLELGAAYRHSNAYAFDIGDVRASGATDAWHISTTLTKGPWIAGFEFAMGDADNALTRPALDERGYEASIGYVLNANLQLTLGWQKLRFGRDSGVFFNGSPTAEMNAEFLHLRFHV
ncbi:MAG TPA: hypothetical protein VN154_01185 [Rhizomicrobium sp.]|nr:hypothetical protein [Rhizomicrobium sp.]